eukprot:scaffold83460_cov66-Cyclotella_meneghiniana.AAC.3
MIPSKYSNSKPQLKTHPTDKQKFHVEKPSNPIDLEMYHAGASRRQSLFGKASNSNKRPLHSSTKQTPFPLTRKRPPNELLEDIKKTYLHSTLDFEAEFNYVGSSRHDLVGKATSNLSMIKLERLTNEIPADVQFKYWKKKRKFECFHEGNDLQDDMPKDITRMMLQDTKRDQQKEDHLQRSTHYDPKRVKVPLEVGVANSHGKNLKEGRDEQDQGLLS